MLSFTSSLSANCEAFAIFVTEKYDYKNKRDILPNDLVQKINSFLDVLKVKKKDEELSSFDVSNQQKCFIIKVKNKYEDCYPQEIGGALFSYIEKFKDIDHIDETLDKLKNISSLNDIEKFDNFASKVKTFWEMQDSENNINKIFHSKNINFKKALQIKKIIGGSGLLSILSSEFRDAKKEYLRMVKSKTYKKKTALKNIEELLVYKNTLPQFKKNKEEIENDNKIKNNSENDFQYFYGASGIAVFLGFFSILCFSLKYFIKGP